MSSPTKTDTVFIKDLIIEMSAGIYDHEKAKKQRVIINITLDVKCNANKTLSSINDVVSYEDVTNEVRNIALTKHYDLLEELAELIATACVAHKHVHQAHIRIEKPDIIADVHTVGIEITRP
ncbi:MAG: hypothetical protein COB14_07815 [Alphaproteobacteria bacterium]|nr:MAG: hypothetical protein COB14_07815 [Alphaproteobacteria bacterium]